MQVSQERAERLILGAEPFQIVSEPGISEHAPGSFMLRAYVKTGRGQEKKRVNSNTAFNTGRFDGGSNYTNRLAAAQAAPRFKLWCECGKPKWEEFHLGLSAAAKAELKRQGRLARLAEERRMFEEGRRLEFLNKKGWDSITRADKWELKANSLADLAKQCHDGVKQIAAWEAKQETQLDNKRKLIEMLEGEEERGRAYIERMQKKLLMQAMVCGQYFHLLSDRDKQKAEHFRNRAEVLRRASTDLKRRRESDANADAVNGDDGDNADDAADARDADEHVLDMFEELDPADPTKGCDVHAIADELAASQGGYNTGRTIRKWAKEFAMNETFKLDMRGRHAPDHILQDEDVKRKIKTFMSDLAVVSGARGLSVDKFWKHVNDVLLPSLAEKDGYRNLLDRTLKNEVTGDYSICRTTAWKWMGRCGANREWHKQGAYTDVHEDEETKAFRKEYLVTNAELQLREPTWVRMPKDVYEEYKAACTAAIKARGGVGHDYEWKPVEPGTPHAYKHGDVEMVELHVDDFEDTEGRFWAERTVSVRFEDPTLPRQPSRRVVVRDIGRNPLSACKFGHSGDVGTCKCHLPIYRLGHDEAVFKAFALPKGVWVIDDVQTLRKKSSGPGEMVSAVQDEDRGFGLPMTTAELATVNQYRELHGRDPLDESPGIQYLRYGKNRDGYWDYEQFEHQAVAVLDAIEALHPNHQVVLEVDWSQGHAKKSEGGLYVSDMNLKLGTTREGYTPMRNSLITHGCLKSGELDGTQTARIRVGDTQSFVFARGDAVNPANANDEEVRAGNHIGHPKGIRQVLWERGLWDQATEPKLSKANAANRLRLCEDFATEQTELQRVFTNRGHILLMSPKAHPELAGKGIEYSWGKAKRDFRQHNDCVAKNLHDNVLKSFDSLPLGRVRKFARKTREYMRAYAKSHMLFGATEADRIEGYHAVRKFVKGSKTHRCTLDQDYAFVGTA